METPTDKSSDKSRSSALLSEGFDERFKAVYDLIEEKDPPEAVYRLLRAFCASEVARSVDN